MKNFKLGLYEKPFQERIVLLENIYKKNFSRSKKIKLMSSQLIDLESKIGKDEFNRFNTESIENGFEGIMIKDPLSFYECKRSTSWLKSKPFIEISLEVKSFEEGTGRNKGKLGAIIAEGEDNGKYFKLNIGSGFTDIQRKEYWDNRNKLPGKIIEIRADSISKSQDGQFWSLRFPRFKTFRGFENKEKL